MKTVTPTSIADQVEAQIDRSQWRTFKFSDVAENINEKISPQSSDLTHYIGLEHLDSGSLKIRRFGDTKSIKGDKLKIYKGDLIFAKRNAYLKRVSVAEFDAIASAHSMVLRARPETVLPEFLPFFMLSEIFWERATAISVGSLSPTINWKALAKQEFLLPPKDQQAKLAELLWAADENVQKLLATERAAMDFRDSTFKASLESLNKKNVKKVFDLLVDGPRNGFSPKTSEDGASYTVSIGAVKDGKFDPDGNLKKATVEESILEKFNVKKDDLVIVRGNGNRLLCGKAGLAKKTHENLFYPDLLIRLRFDHNKIAPEFAAYQWNHPSAHYRLLQRAKSTNGISKINGGDIKNHTLIVPPISEQSKILDHIEKIENRVRALGETKARAIQLEKSLINQIF